MADTKISALPAITSVDGTDVFPVIEAGATKRTTVSQIASYIKGVTALYNASVANQSIGATDTYLTGSSIPIPVGALQAETMYRCVFQVSKGAAGTGTGVVTVRIGTAGTTTDAARTVHTFPAVGTAIADSATIEVFVTFRSVGSGTVAVIQTCCKISRTNTTTGFVGTGGTNIIILNTTSGGFDSTVANSIIGLSVNGGTAAAWTVSLVQAELINLA